MLTRALARTYITYIHYYFYFFKLFYSTPNLKPYRNQIAPAQWFFFNWRSMPRYDYTDSSVRHDFVWGRLLISSRTEITRSGIEKDISNGYLSLRWINKGDCSEKNRNKSKVAWTLGESADCSVGTAALHGHNCTGKAWQEILCYDVKFVHMQRLSSQIPCITSGYILFSGVMWSSHCSVGLSRV